MIFILYSSPNDSLFTFFVSSSEEREERKSSALFSSVSKSVKKALLFRLLGLGVACVGTVSTSGAATSGVVTVGAGLVGAFGLRAVGLISFFAATVRRAGFAVVVAAPGFEEDSLIIFFGAVVMVVVVGAAVARLGLVVVSLIGVFETVVAGLEDNLMIFLEAGLVV